MVAGNNVAPIRARGLGVPFAGETGLHNAITDVGNVAVGYSTIFRGDGPLRVGLGPVRTGVTAIMPRGHAGVAQPVFAATHTLNGNGELTGSLWVEESGQLEGPITLTNTHSCGVARDATVRWLVERHGALTDVWSLSVAGETYDGELNDINGFHVTADHVFEAIDTAAPGALALGSVGGGTGMICYDFKGGCGSSSRQFEIDGQKFTLGVFVQANFGIRAELMIAGVPVGEHITGGEVRSKPTGSIIAIVATDVPLLPHQLKRLARRVSLGMARTGSVSHNGSGDIFLAFTTAQNVTSGSRKSIYRAEFIDNSDLNPVFTAVVQATEEAIIDSMVVNATMTGRDGITVHALPHDKLCETLRTYNRLGNIDSP